MSDQTKINLQKNNSIDINNPLHSLSKGPYSVVTIPEDPIREHETTEEAMIFKRKKSNPSYNQMTVQNPLSPNQQFDNGVTMETKDLFPLMSTERGNNEATTI